MPYLSVEDRKLLVTKLSQQYDLVQGSIERRTLLKSAGLDLFLTVLPLGDGVAPSKFAADLVDRLEEYGPWPEDRRYETLGKLLSDVVEREELPESVRGPFARLIVRYDMVKEPTYIAGLRKRFQIDEPLARLAPGGAPLGAPMAFAPPPQPALPVLNYETQPLERIINDKDNFLDVAQLAGALYSARAVCLIQNPKGTAFGTGFLIGPDLLLTNNHVLPSEGHLDGAAALFDFANGLDGVPTRSRAFAFQKGFYHSSPPEALDFALVKLTEKPLPGLSDEDRKQKTGLLDLFQSGKHRGYLLLASDTIRNGHRLNILQHPDGMPLKAVLTRNYVPTDMTATRVHYLADTMGGSSGSPVFNAGWEVVALHHSGEPYPPEDLAAIARKAWKGVFRVNEGIPMSAILKNFKDNGIAKFLPGNE